MPLKSPLTSAEKASMLQKIILSFQYTVLFVGFYSSLFTFLFSLRPQGGYRFQIVSFLCFSPPLTFSVSKRYHLPAYLQNLRNLHEISHSANG